MVNAELLGDPVGLTQALVDIESVSGEEKQITDAVEQLLRTVEHLQVQRVGNVVCARTELGRSRRVILAGHLDTVPVHDNVPATVADGRIYGCGSADMKGGVAIALHVAATTPQPVFDVTYLYYDCEEVDAARNGLNQVSASHPDWLHADFAILLEPTYGLVEAGCQGSLRAIVAVPGRRAHSARSWQGVNAIHAAGEVLARLQGYKARRPTIDGCQFREGLNAVGIQGGVAGNVIPDRCEVEVSFRFAPDRSEADAVAHVAEVFAGFELNVTDLSPAALPGLHAEPAQRFIATVGIDPVAKLGWTDVSRFAALGVPALNFGPGDPELAHTQAEYVEIGKILAGVEVLQRWLGGA